MKRLELTRELLTLPITDIDKVIREINRDRAFREAILRESRIRRKKYKSMKP